jgi:hypothetical protein
VCQSEPRGGSVAGLSWRGLRRVQAIRRAIRHTRSPTDMLRFAPRRKLETPIWRPPGAHVWSAGCGPEPEGLAIGANLSPRADALMVPDRDQRLQHFLLQASGRERPDRPVPSRGARWRAAGASARASTGSIKRSGSEQEGDAHWPSTLLVRCVSLIELCGTLGIWRMQNPPSSAPRRLG